MTSLRRSGQWVEEECGGSWMSSDGPGKPVDNESRRARTDSVSRPRGVYKTAGHGSGRVFGTHRVLAYKRLGHETLMAAARDEPSETWRAYVELGTGEPRYVDLPHAE
jgi:hypothetical protein